MRSPEPPIWLPAAGLILLLAGGGLWWFGPSFDHRLFDLAKLGAGDRFAAPALLLSTIGGLAWLGPLAFAFVLWLIWRKRPAEALWLLLTVASGRLLVEALKLGFDRPRPPMADRLTIVTSLSFPSSHSAGSMLTALALAMIFTVRGHTLFVPAIAFACAVGWSRMALGVHWPADVLAGLGFGMLWVAMARRWLFKARLPSSEPV
ncbi:MAG: phosphatase PAP2 family protein [Sphingomonadales bacterium]|nr:MAG: phosphatase PAP2 family protein [Sphingomonadales bacterium]